MQLNLEKTPYMQNFDAIKVFNNANCMLYSKQGYTKGWNGTYNNGALSQGAYYYLIDFGAGFGLY